MLVRDRMTRKVVSIEPDRPLSEAREVLQRHRFRQLPVMRKGQLIGIITNRDLRGTESAEKTVAELMTAKPFTIAPDAAVDEAARILRRYKIGALPVMDRKALVGILSISDVLDAFVELSGVAEHTYRLSLIGGSGPQMEARARRAVERGRGEIKWTHRDARQRPQCLHLRVKMKRVDDVVAALRAEGFEVSSVVSSAHTP